MKDLEIGQKVWVVKNNYVRIVGGIVVKKFENTLRWKVELDYGKMFGDFEADDKITEFCDNHLIFSSFKEAYTKAMNIFDERVKKIEDDRQRFKAEIQIPSPSGDLIPDKQNPQDKEWSCDSESNRRSMNKNRTFS